MSGTPGAYERVTTWFARQSRPLPWREAGTSAWGVLVSEVMSQQTPVSRVAGPWRDWMERWPTPADLAAASTADVLRAWGTLGYPRRALRLQQAARAVEQRHGNEVPSDEAALLDLPGIGCYTAAAVRAFAFGRRSLVLDTNVRRVLARYVGAAAYPPPSQTAGERERAWALVPEDATEASLWSVSVMELGALVCTARSPRCEECPLAADCAWLEAGRPAWEGAERVGQSWHGTDRQCRGRVMAALRGAVEPVGLSDIAWPDRVQLERCVHALVEDGLARQTGRGITLPA